MAQGRRDHASGCATPSSTMVRKPMPSAASVMAGRKPYPAATLPPGRRPRDRECGRREKSGLPRGVRLALEGVVALQPASGTVSRLAPDTITGGVLFISLPSLD